MQNTDGPCCGNCHHSRQTQLTRADFQEGRRPKVHCHRYPPQVLPTVSVNPLTGQPEAGAIAIFVEVPPDQSCGEWTPRGTPRRQQH